MDIKKIHTLGDIEYFATKNGEILRKLKHNREPRSDNAKQRRVYINGDGYIRLKPYSRGKERMLDNHYVSVDLSGRGTMPVHRLIAESFIGDIGDNVVNHKNGIKNDNRLENIEIITKYENLKHAMENGLRKSIDYDLVKKLLKTSILSQKEIAKEVGASVGAIEKYIRANKINRSKKYSRGEALNRTREKLIGSKWYKDE